MTLKVRKLFTSGPPILAAWGSRLGLYIYIEREREYVCVCVSFLLQGMLGLNLGGLVPCLLPQFGSGGK